MQNEIEVIFGIFAKAKTEQESDGSFSDLSRMLVNNVLAEEEKVQFQLYSLSKGGCAAPEEVWRFSGLDQGRICSAVHVVDDWMKEKSRGEILSQAAILGKFEYQDKLNIAAMAWKNPVC